MLHHELLLYLEDTETAIRNIKEGHVELYEEEILTEERLNLRIRVRFINGCLLELNEAVIIEAEKIKYLDYRYHFQNNKNNLIFRYDNTPHFPEFERFPHHKHTK